jgi:hypothetical protein
MRTGREAFGEWESLDRFPYLIDRIEPAKETLRGEGFYDLESYKESLFLIDKWLEVLSTLYFPTRLTVVDNQFGNYSIYSSKDLMKIIRDESQNPYIQLFRKHFIQSIVGDQPDLIGVSITATSQIIPGLTLCRLIKAAPTPSPVGSIHQTGRRRASLPESIQADRRYHRVRGRDRCSNSSINWPGKRFQQSPEPDLSPERKITVNQPFYSENINQLPAPNYDGFPLGLYLSPEPVLPVQFSRGCYYKDCAFCALTLDHQNFRQKEPGRTVEELEWLKQRYGAQHFFFTDECFALSPTKRLCQQIIDKADIKWTCEMRFESISPVNSWRRCGCGCLKIVFD